MLCDSYLVVSSYLNVVTQYFVARDHNEQISLKDLLYLMKIVLKFN